MKRFQIALLLAIAAVTIAPAAFAETLPKDAWLTFQPNFKKSMTFGYCYGLQDAYLSFNESFPGLNDSQLLGLSEKDMNNVSAYLRHYADLSVVASKNVEAFIAHVDAICSGKGKIKLERDDASLQAILNLALTTFKK